MSSTADALTRGAAAGAWAKLVGSIRSYRSPGARFFKPVCVICAIDLTDEGEPEHEWLDPDAIILRFRRNVGVVFPERADQGWRPLWHLSNDGLWTFRSGDRVVGAKDFGAKRKPDTKTELFQSFDRLSIAGPYAEAWRSPERRRELRNAMVAMLATTDDETCQPFARQLQDPSLALRPGAWPADLGRAEREQLDIFGEPTGVERDEPDSSWIIKEPFDPDSIDVVTRHLSVDLLLARVRRNMLDLQPDFQRRWGVWNAANQSRLIESMLLRIPLPVFYAAEGRDERWEVVDGIQRLSTIARFIEPDIVGSAPLVLTSLEYLRDYEGKTFGDLNDRLKLRLLETELQVHLIRQETPQEVKFNVFKRINTGGVPLSPQEIRHAITPGPARKLLEDLTEEPAFQKATGYSVRSTRMDDRELVLRFLAFSVLGPDAYRTGDMDGFLIGAMRQMNLLDREQVDLARRDFVAAMTAASAIFQEDAFRKRQLQSDKRKPISKALFETVAVNLARLDELSRTKLCERRSKTRAGLVELCNERAFEGSISHGTGDVAKVKRRFADVERLFNRMINDDWDR